MRTLLVIFVMLLTGCGPTGGGNGIGSGRGKKIGQIVRLSQEGAWCITYEGELLRGGLNGGSGVLGAPFHFTTLSKDVYDKLQVVMAKQQEIEIEYMKAHIHGGCQPSDKSEGFLLDFRILDPAQRRLDLEKELEELKNR